MSSQEPYSPSHTPALAPVRRLATAASILIVTVCVTNALTTLADWNLYVMARGYLETWASNRDGLSPQTVGIGADDVAEAERMRAIATRLNVVALIAAGVVFLVWLWRARRNAELINSAEHRLRRGWTIGGWFCPIVNLWYPTFVLDDIWRTSRPDAPNDTPGIRRSQPSRLVLFWWFSWLASLLALVWLAIWGDIREVSLLKDVAAVDTVRTPLQALAGALIIMVIRQITRWQSAHDRPA